MTVFPLSYQDYAYLDLRYHGSERYWNDNAIIAMAVDKLNTRTRAALSGRNKTKTSEKNHIFVSLPLQEEPFQSGHGFAF